MSAQEVWLAAHRRSLRPLQEAVPGQALFAGLKIKASWPGPCWQRGGRGGPAPGLKGIWLEKEASSSTTTTSIVGSVGVPRESPAPQLLRRDAGRGSRGTGCPFLTPATQGCPSPSPEASNNLGPPGRHKSPPSTLSPLPADNTDNNNRVPVAPVGKAL